MQDTVVSKSHIKYIRISPKKLVRIARELRKRPVNQALDILSNLPHKGAVILKKALLSAISNAKNKSGVDSNGLYISTLLINSGVVIKRYQPRARGRMFMIKKRTSHVYYELSSKEN